MRKNNQTLKTTQANLIGTKEETEMSKDNPCYGCTERTITCHIDCEEHAKWKTKKAEEKARIAEQRQIERLYYMDRVNLYKKATKKRNAHK